MTYREQTDDGQRGLRYYLWCLTPFRNKEAGSSFYLLIAMIVALLLGGPLLLAREDPTRFAFYLSLYFVFFFAVLYRAVVDFVEISKRHLKDREQVYRDTLGAEDFVKELSERVAEKSPE